MHACLSLFMLWLNLICCPYLCSIYTKANNCSVSGNRESVQSIFLDWSSTSMISGPVPHNDEGQCMNPYFFFILTNVQILLKITTDCCFPFMKILFSDFLCHSLRFCFIFSLFLYCTPVFAMPLKITIEGNLKDERNLLCPNGRGSIHGLYQVLPSKCH